MAVQISLLPDEAPDEFITEAKRRRGSLRRRIRQIIKSEGVYNYALLAKEVMNGTDEYIKATYGMGRYEIKKLLYSEFGIAVGYQENLDDYLEKVKNIPGFGIKKIDNNAQIKHRKNR
jgi:hypothetical protein